MAEIKSNFNVCLRFHPNPAALNAEWGSCVIRHQNGFDSLGFNSHLQVEDWANIFEGVGYGDIEQRLSYSRIYEEFEETSSVYNHSCSSLVKQALEGFDATIMTYGESMTGKTFTMYGNEVGGFTQQGVAHQAVQQILTHKNSLSQNEDIQLYMSMLQIKNNVVNDLIAGKSNQWMGLDLRESEGSQVYVSGLSQISIESLHQFESILEFGLASIEKPAHVIVRFQIETRILGTCEKPGQEGGNSMRSSVLQLVDLAGEGWNFDSFQLLDKIDMVEETTETKDLVYFRNILHSIVKGQPNVAFNESKLCHYLKPVILGKTLTQVICTASSSVPNLEGTTKTLAFGVLAQQVQTKVRKNDFVMDYSAMTAFKRRVETLEKQIVAHQQQLIDKEESISRLVELTKLETESASTASDISKKDVAVHLPKRAARIPAKKQYAPVKKQPPAPPPKAKTDDVIRKENQILRLELHKLRSESEQKKKLFEKELLSFSQTSSLGQAFSTDHAGTQTERNEYMIFGQIVQLIMDRFPELRTRIIKKEDFMTLFLHFNKMQSDITQEIYRNAGFIPKEQIHLEFQKLKQPDSPLAYSKKQRPISASMSVAPSMKFEDLVEKSDIFSASDDDFLSVLSREDSILSAKSMRQLEELMVFDVENPLDTQKVQNFIHKEKEQSEVKYGGRRPDPPKNEQSMIASLERESSFEQQPMNQNEMTVVNLNSTVHKFTVRKLPPLKQPELSSSKRQSKYSFMEKQNTFSVNQPFDMLQSSGSPQQQSNQINPPQQRQMQQQASFANRGASRGVNRGVSRGLNRGVSRAGMVRASYNTFAQTQNNNKMNLMSQQLAHSQQKYSQAERGGLSTQMVGQVKKFVA